VANHGAQRSKPNETSARNAKEHLVKRTRMNMLFRASGGGACRWFVRAWLLSSRAQTCQENICSVSARE
jgi:hypothetical protein